MLINYYNNLKNPKKNPTKNQTKTKPKAFETTEKVTLLLVIQTKSEEASWEAELTKISNPPENTFLSSGKVVRNLQTCKIPRKDKNVLVRNALYGHIACSMKEYNYVKYLGICNPVWFCSLSFDLFTRGTSSS